MPRKRPYLIKDIENLLRILKYICLRTGFLHSLEDRLFRRRIYAQEKRQFLTYSDLALLSFMVRRSFWHLKD